jgi:hypothetical protein
LSFFGPLVLLCDGWCLFQVSHGLVDVVVSGLSHDFSVIAGLINSNILTFFFMPLDDLSKSASQEFTVSMKKGYEKLCRWQ